MGNYIILVFLEYKSYFNMSNPFSVFEVQKGKAFLPLSSPNLCPSELVFLLKVIV